MPCFLVMLCARLIIEVTAVASERTAALLIVCYGKAVVPMLMLSQEALKQLALPLVTGDDLM